VRLAAQEVQHDHLALVLGQGGQEFVEMPERHRIVRGIGAGDRLRRRLALHALPVGRAATQVVGDVARDRHQPGGERRRPQGVRRLAAQDQEHRLGRVVGVRREVELPRARGVHQAAIARDDLLERGLLTSLEGGEQVAIAAPSTELLRIHGHGHGAP
jgi:hypothetical protein